MVFSTAAGRDSGQRNGRKEVRTGIWCGNRKWRESVEGRREEAGGRRRWRAGNVRRSVREVERERGRER